MRRKDAAIEAEVLALLAAPGATVASVAEQMAARGRKVASATVWRISQRSGAAPPSPKSPAPEAPPARGVSGATHAAAAVGAARAARAAAVLEGQEQEREVSAAELDAVVARARLGGGDVSLELLEDVCRRLAAGVADALRANDARTVGQLTRELRGAAKDAARLRPPPAPDPEADPQNLECRDRVRERFARLVEAAKRRGATA